MFAMCECVPTHAHAAKSDTEETNIMLHMEVTRRRLLLDDFEEQVRNEKKIVQQLQNDKIQQESYLSFQDAVIEELEANVEEIS
jgi:hypothetical protein